MAFDGFFTRKIVNELTEKILFGKINKINNISNNEFIFTIRKNKNKKLLISCNPKTSRIQLTNNSYENAYSPANFCTVLRKYLNNGYILDINQINNDRIVEIKIKNNDELGYEKYYYLIIEIMGKHSNIILTDDNKKIIDALKNNYDIEYSRATVSGIEYRIPPTIEKINPFNNSNIETIIDSNNYIEKFYGISKLLNEYLKNFDKNYFKNFIENFDTFNTPTYFVKNNKSDFYYFKIVSNCEEKITFNSYSELLDFFYMHNLENNSNKEIDKTIQLFLKNKITRLNKKINILEEEYKKTKNDNNNEIKGNLLLSNNYLFKKHVPSEVTLQNFYSENLEDITITLDNNISIEKNAEKYFNKHKKNKRTLKNIEDQLKLAKLDIEYFETIVTHLSSADISDLEDIKEELANHGFKAKKSNRKQKNKIKYTIINFKDIEIYVGKNNLQNDAITNKLAKRNYTWLHAKDVPGSHVVIFSDNPDMETINIAAMLAGYFSKLKTEKYALVDYTLIKYVKKISGAKPGMVTYTNQTTIKVKLDKQLITSLL